MYYQKMVLEHLFPESWLEKKFSLSFFLGLGYTIIGIVLAKLLFGANSGIVSVIFISILLIPSLRKLFVREEKIEEKEKKFTFKKFYRDNKHLVFAYLGIFIGVYVAYFLIAFLSMKFGWNVTSMFGEQLFLDPAIAGRATYQFGIFWSILANNWWVLMACFLLSLISGNGATFFIVWNASAWAAIFAVRAVGASAVLGVSSIKVAAIMQVITLPHILLEGGAYILAGIAGAVISDDAVSKSSDLKAFIPILLGVVAIFFVLNMFFTSITNLLPILVMLRMLTVFGLVYLLGHAFPDKKHKEVFTYNYWLFVIALLVFILGALVETGVLSFSGTLNMYYSAAQMFFLG